MALVLWNKYSGVEIYRFLGRRGNLLPDVTRTPHLQSCRSGPSDAAEAYSSDGTPKPLRVTINVKDRRCKTVS